MLKLKLNDDNVVTIDQNDRANWQLKVADFERGRIELEGFGGENEIVIIAMGMQDATIDLVAVHSCVDNPATVVQKRYTVGYFDAARTTFAINDLLVQVCDYPEQLTVDA